MDDVPRTHKTIYGLTWEDLSPKKSGRLDKTGTFTTEERLERDRGYSKFRAIDN